MILKFSSNLSVCYYVVVLISLILSGCGIHTDSSEINHALINKTEELRLKGQTDSLLELNAKYIGISKQQNYAKGEILGYINIANIYATIGKYNDGISYLKIASDMLRTYSDDYLKMRLYHEYGQMNFVMGFVDVALSYNSKAMYFAERNKSINDKRIKSNIYTVRADFISAKHPDSTLIYFHKGLKIDNSELNNALIGNYYSVTGTNLDSADSYLKKALKMLENQEYWTVRRGIIYSFYGNYLYEQEKLGEALVYYEKAADILYRTNRINKLPLLYEKIIQTSELLNDKQKVEEYKLKYRTTNDSLIAYTLKATDIALSNSIIEIDKYKREKQNSTTILFVLLLAFLSILLGGYAYFRKQKRNLSENDVSDNLTQSDILPDIIKLAKENNPEFLSRFNENYPEFQQKLYSINQDLSPANLSFCALIWLGFSSKEIAQFTFLQHRSVQTQKTRIRKKLDIPSDTDLYKYFREL